MLQYNKFRKYSKDNGAYRFTSWFDYLLYGDVYILGFGASFSEFDFWWMLERRMREKDKQALGKYYFYEPLTESNEIKKALLSKMGVEYRSLDMVFTSKTKDYREFYRKAIEDMGKIMR